VSFTGVFASQFLRVAAILDGEDRSSRVGREEKAE